MAVSSVFCSIAIAALLVIGLMLFTIANYKAQELPALQVYQTAAPESELEEPPKKARVQQSSSRPTLPSPKFIQANVSSPLSIQTPPINVPTMDFEIGIDAEGVDFGNGGTGLGNGKGKKGRLGRMEISADQLGVVLDNSGSMSGVLPALEKQIAKQFPWALTMRVRGCAVTGGMEQTDDQDSTLAAIRYLVETGEADAIFWFCDLHDTRDVESVLSLGKYLREKKVNLYLSSTSKSPDEELQGVVTKFSRWSPMRHVK